MWMDTRLEEIASAIGRYLVINPHAADSARGIAQWWLPSVGAKGTPEEVELALLLLQARGIVKSIRIDDHQDIWRGIA